MCIIDENLPQKVHIYKWQTLTYDLCLASSSIVQIYLSLYVQMWFHIYFPLNNKKLKQWKVFHSFTIYQLPADAKSNLNSTDAKLAP